MIDPARLAAVREREEATFAARTRRSAELTERARRHLPDGVPMAWMAGLYDHPPLYVAHGAGCRFTDVDGNDYLDFNQADLSATCGFAPPAVLAAIAERASRGLQFLLPVEEGIEAAELLAERYGLPAWQFTLSASGANAEAIRLARHRTGRELIVVFAGHYHGHVDDMLVTGDETGARPELLGVNPRAAADTRVLPFNDLDALERVLARGDVAAAITEPALTNVGVVLPDDGYLAGARERTRAHGALLIFDETHTQTAAYGGLTRARGLEPDIVTLGKSLGGGVPIGAYGMTDDLRDWMTGHLDAYGRRIGLATGGTTYANPLSLAAATAVLREIHTRRRSSAPLRSGSGSPTGSRPPPRATGCPGARTGSAAGPATAWSRSCRATPPRPSARSTTSSSTRAGCTWRTAGCGTRSPAPGRPRRSPTPRRTSTPTSTRSRRSSQTWSRRARAGARTRPSTATRPCWRAGSRR